MFCCETKYLFNLRCSKSWRATSLKLSFFTYVKVCYCITDQRCDGIHTKHLCKEDFVFDQYRRNCDRFSVMLNKLGTHSARFGLVKMLQYVHVCSVRDELCRRL